MDVHRNMGALVDRDHLKPSQQFESPGLLESENQLFSEPTSVVVCALVLRQQQQKNTETETGVVLVVRRWCP